MFICLVDCGHPGTPRNGSVMFDDTLEGSVATYTCDFGFGLVGDSERTCQFDQTWTGTEPTCTCESNTNYIIA